MSFRSDGTRPGAGDGVSPPLAPSQGCEAGDDVRRDDGVTARCRALGMESPLLLLPVRDAKQETTTAETTGRRHEAGRQSLVSPPSRSQSGMRVGDDVRRDNGATARGRALGMESPLLSLPVRDVSRGPQWRYHEGVRGMNKLGVF